MRKSHNHLRGKSCTSHHKTIAFNEIESFVSRAGIEIIGNESIDREDN